jgi:hypothetical protein
MLVIALLILILIILLLIPYRGEIGGLGKLLMRKRPIWPVFWALVVVFIINLSGFIPAVAHLMIGPVYALVFVLYLVLGILLVVLAVRNKVGGWLEKSLIVTGIAPLGVVVAFFLGEVISSALPGSSPVWDIIIYLFMGVFVIGAISSIILARKPIN